MNSRFAEVCVPPGDTDGTPPSRFFTGTSSMPQMGHLPGASACTEGCIGAARRRGGLPRLRHELVAEQLDVMMRRRDLLERVAQRADRFGFSSLQARLRCGEIRARLGHARGVFPGIAPGHAEGNASV